MHLIQIPTEEQTFHTHVLVFECMLLEGQVQINVSYDSSILSESSIQTLSYHFERVVQQLTMEQLDNVTVGSIDLFSPHNLQQLRKWNDDHPDTIWSCVHHLIERQAALRPDAEAISAWDGKFSYGEFDAAASRLACYLVEHYDVGPNSFIPVCFEKSAWILVSMLAIMKAGGAFVPFDPSHPEARQQSIIDTIGATVMLASPSTRSKCARMVKTVIEVTPALVASLSRELAQPSGPRTKVTPRDACYVLFTSGSTGVPKGVILDHFAACTAQTAISKRLKLDPTSRVLQFASYVFDLSISEIFAPLITGACICVPSEYDRMNDIPTFMCNQRVDWALLTPSFARLLSSDNIPHLKALLLAGEAVGKDLLDYWIGKVRLINGWGPTETCVFSTIHEWESLANASPGTIGTNVGGLCWIVEVENHNRLSPIGCTGEIVVQGPTLAREYLHSPEKTAAAFITLPPSWLPDKLSKDFNRLYKTGDLGRYNADGTMEFLGRKDTQVKLRGHRIELGEIEHHVIANLQGVKQAAVDVAKMTYNTGVDTLIAYLCFSGESRIVDAGDVDDVVLAPDQGLRTKLVSLVSLLTTLLPRYMVPTMFIPLKYMPTITSTKLDRARLRNSASSLSTEQIAALS